VSFWCTTCGPAGARVELDVLGFDVTDDEVAAAGEDVAGVGLAGADVELDFELDVQPASTTRAASTTAVVHRLVI
jgi:hypothetical protein